MAGVAPIPIPILIPILILASLLPAAATPCGALRPDNSTAAKLLGTWLYVAGAAQLPRHLLEMLLIDHGYLHVEPGASEQELPITQSVAVGDQCLTNNSTYMEITDGNTTLVKEARNLSMSRAQREEFKTQAKCLGLSEEGIVYAPWRRELCQMEEADKGNSPWMEPTAAVTASPSPGTPMLQGTGKRSHVGQ
ncbi:uncharacterized protein LOC133211731 isoform X2 [Neopsephotus bourkii]|uniref:uncharacterized protein LOC133211731 isoform X2 n=1 Tax=Neopsephotus bourkii TaxID=309878 RepID=UPI002AA51618|nr:uncharacterized protein LOC133211731 isoform X2 [Neopsephotus bourkii]